MLSIYLRIHSTLKSQKINRITALYFYLNIHEVFTVKCTRILPVLFFNSFNHTLKCFTAEIILQSKQTEPRLWAVTTLPSMPCRDTFWTTSPHAERVKNVTESDTKEKSQGVCRSGGEGAGQKRRHGLLHGGHDKARSIIVSVKDGGHTSNGIFSP